MKKALVILSGGQDSTTCLFWAIAQGWDVYAVTFDYGQKHAIEIQSAIKIAQLAGIADKHEIISLGPILAGTSPLTNPEMELEQYRGHSALPGGLEKTFVPMRNQLFITLAANRAYVLGAQILVTGVCQEDSGGYPDCRRGFIDYLTKTINAGTFTGEDGTLGPIRIETPLMNMTKAESVELAMELSGCYEALAYTHTAYDGRYPPTGSDHATLLREKGFAEADIPDPLWLRYAVEACAASEEERTLHSFLPTSAPYNGLNEDELHAYCMQARILADTHEVSE